MAAGIESLVIDQVNMLPGAQTADTAGALGPPLQHEVVVVGAAGANASHMDKAIRGLGDKHTVNLVDIRDPATDFGPNQLHRTDTEEGQTSLRTLIQSRAVRAAYLSLVPSIRPRFTDEYLRYAGEGLLNFVVVPKPAAQSVKEMRDTDRALRAAEARRREILGEGFDPDADPLLYIHEHYIGKGAWHTFQEQLGAVSDQLGRLTSVAIDISEARTVEQEGRLAAFAGGAIEDLGPHVLSLALGIQDSINAAGRYSIPNGLSPRVQRLRYDGSELAEDVETGFVIQGTTKITDSQEDNKAHDLEYLWRGGKGIEDRKEVVLEFEHPDTKKRTTVTVDLAGNTLHVPDSVSHLFPETQFVDNGYGYVVEVGLNGGDPNQSFQSWNQARVVTKMQHVLRRLGRGAMRPHAQGESFAVFEVDTDRQMEFTRALQEGASDGNFALAEEILAQTAARAEIAENDTENERIASEHRSFADQHMRAVIATGDPEIMDAYAQRLAAAGQEDTLQRF